MNILVNGQAREVSERTTITELLALLEIREKHVAVEVNLVLVPRAQHAEHQLQPEDQLEVVTLVGGG